MSHFSVQALPNFIKGSWWQDCLQVNSVLHADYNNFLKWFSLDSFVDMRHMIKRRLTRVKTAMFCRLLSSFCMHSLTPLWLICVLLCGIMYVLCNNVWTIKFMLSFIGSTAAEHLLFLRMTHNIFSQKLLKCCLVCKMQPQFYLSNKPIYQYFDCPSDIFARTDFI